MPRVLALIAAVVALHVPATDGGAETPRAVHHEVRVRLDPESRELRVEDRFVVEAKDVIAFDLATWLKLVEARVDGKTVAADRVGARTSLPKVAPGLRQVEIELRGSVPPLPGPDTRAVSRGAVAGAEGSYLPGYAAWMPDTGDGRIEFDLIVEVPMPYRAVATGRLVEEQVDGGTYRASFAAGDPTEPPSIFAGPYVVGERLEGDLRLRTYFHPELVPLADQYMTTAAAYIRRYAGRIGAYPHADFHIVSAPLPVGLGFPNLTYVGRMVLPLPFMRGRSLAHEVLHSWWGNGIAVDYGKGNWAEGLTTYMADYALAEDRGEEAAREMRLGWLRNISALPPAQDMPVVRFTAKGHDATQVVGYDKVAFVFRMLEAEIGKPAFDAGLRRFWQDHRFRAADWSDLRAAFEAAAERDLGWFFDQWLSRTGAPRIELVGTRRRDAGGRHGVALRVRQSAPAYRLNLPVVIETAKGFRRFEITLEQTEQRFELTSEQEPLALHIDPDFEALRELLPGESPPILRDVTLSRETVLVVATDEAALAVTAQRLARRLLQRKPRLHGGDPSKLENVPVLVIGGAEQIARLRARMDLPGNTTAGDEIIQAGTARAWVERRSERDTWLFVAADDAASLEAVLRPLPHYRSQSYVVFNGPRSVKKGLWPGGTSPLSSRFRD